MACDRGRGFGVEEQVFEGFEGFRSIGFTKACVRGKVEGLGGGYAGEIGVDEVGFGVRG